jgi:glucose-1-phosphate adenylyltransferase
MVEHHLDLRAGVTVAAIPIDIGEASQFGIIETKGDGRIARFHEKPAQPPAMPSDPSRALASMGNYVFDTQTLIDIVSPAGDDGKTTDIGGDVIPALTDAGVAHVYDFSTNVIPGQSDHERGYWRDVGTLDAYYDANMDLLRQVPPFSLYNREWPVYSLQLPLPPAKIDRGPSGQQALVLNSLMCAGSIVSGGQVERSIVGPECYIDGSAQVTESILFPGVRVGPGARVHRAVIDKNVIIPAGVSIGHDAAHDRERFTVSDHGIVVIEKDRSL